MIPSTGPSRPPGGATPVSGPAPDPAPDPTARPVVVGAAVVIGGRLLAQQRSYPAEVAGRWELPGGRVEAGESEPDAVRRECVEELGLDVVVGDRVGDDVALPNGAVLRIFAAVPRDPRPRPRPLEHRALRWLPAAELADVDWLPADRVLVPALTALVASP